jgi:hypothetical protein
MKKFLLILIISIFSFSLVSAEKSTPIKLDAETLDIAYLPKDFNVNHILYLKDKS